MEFRNWIIYLLLAVIIVLFILLYWRINKNEVESFMNEGEILAKQLTTNYQDNSIWSNRITALKSRQLISPISFWSPNLSITNNIGYYKIGDTLSTNNFFTAPENETVLVKGDVQEPTKYDNIVNISNQYYNNLTPEQQESYSFLFSNINNFDNLDEIKSKLNEILYLLGSQENSLKTKLYNYLLGYLGAYRYSANLTVETDHGRDFKITNMMINYDNSKFMNDSESVANISKLIWETNQNWNVKTNLENTNKSDIGIYVLKNTYNELLSGNRIDSNNNPIKNTYYHLTDYVLALPMGFKFEYIDSDNLTVSTPPQSISTSESSSQINESIKLILNENIVQTSNASNKYLTSSKIINWDMKIPLNRAINSLEVKYSINNILEDIASFTSTNFINIIKNSLDSVDVYLQNTYITYNNPIAVITNRKLDENNNYSKFGRNVNITIDKEFPNTVLQRVNTISFGWVFNNNTEFGKIITKIKNMVDLLDEINLQNINELPLIIYRPVCNSEDYISLGDIVLTNAEQIKLVNNTPTLACISKNCVKDVRNWRLTDIVYENSNPYFAIFLNPYTGTFKTSTIRGEVPSGMVEKIVVCIENCKAVDNLIKSDKCAKQIAKYNKNIISNTPIIDTSAMDEEDNYYQEKLANRENKIQTIKDGVQLLKLRDNQTDIINKSRSRQNLQFYLDKQASNIDNVRSNLENGKSKIEANIKIPSQYKIDIVKKVIEVIDNSNLQNKDDIIARIIASQRGKQSLISQDDLNARIDDILNNCPEVNPNLIKKSIVKSLCVGCNL
jgi:hypothetical protein